MKAIPNPIKAFYVEYKLFILAALGFWLYLKLRGLFNAVGTVSDTVATVVAGATASATTAAKQQQQKVAIKTVNPGATAADLVVFENHAKILADSMGYLPGSWANVIFADRPTALSIAKKYSHYLFTGSVRDRWIVNGKWVYPERKPSLRLPVLYPFYEQVTGGRSLASDLERCMNLWSDDIKTFYQTIIK